MAGVRALHLDVMDGHFVPNLSYGPPVIADWRPRSDLPFDAHLMMSDPGRYLDAFVQAGCDEIIVHIEAVPDPVALLRQIRRSGCRAALALNPPTPVESVLPFLAELDKVLVMSVMPGFGGQSFEPKVLDKVRALRAERSGLEIAIDGRDQALQRRLGGRGGGHATGRRVVHLARRWQLRGEPGRVGRGHPSRGTLRR